MNVAVGTKQGQAFIYDRSNNLEITGTDAPVSLYLDQIEAEKKARQEAKTKKAAADKGWEDAMKGIGDQEYWYRHEEVIKDELDQVYEMGADIRAAGVANPALGTDAASREWQKKYTRLMAMTQASRQLKEVEKNFMTELGTQGDDKRFSAQSIGGFKDYLYNVPLEDHMANKLPTPMLMLEEPTFLKHDQDMDDRKKLKDSGVEPGNFSDEEFETFAQQTLSRPETNRNILSQISSMNDAAKEGLKKRAASAGRNPDLQLHIEQITPLYKGDDSEFDFYATIDQVKPKVKESGGTRAGSVGSYEGLSTSSNKYLDPREVEIRTESYLANSNWTRKAYMGGYFLVTPDPDATMEEMKEAGRAAIPQHIRSQSATGSTSRFTPQREDEYSFGEEDQLSAEELWLEDFRSGDPTRMQNAGGYFQGMEPTKGATINTATSVTIPTGKRYFDQSGNEIGIEDAFETSKVNGQKAIKLKPGVRAEETYSQEMVRDASGNEVRKQDGVRFTTIKEVKRPSGTVKEEVVLFDLVPEMSDEMLRTYYRRARESASNNGTPYRAEEIARRAGKESGVSSQGSGRSGPKTIVPRTTTSATPSTISTKDLNGLLGRKN